jgi:hypothetical protein
MSEIVPEYDKFLQQTLRSQVLRERSFSLSLYGFLVFLIQRLCALSFWSCTTLIHLFACPAVVIAAASNLIEAGN